MTDTIETKSDIITIAHSTMAAMLQENHDATPLHKHYFVSAVSQGIESSLKDFEHIEIYPKDVTAMVDISFDVARTVAESGGLYYTECEAEC